MKALFLESLPYESAFTVGSHHYATRFLTHGWDGMWLSHPLSPLHLVHPVKRDFEVRMRSWRSGPIDYGALAYYNPMTVLPATTLPLLRSRAVARTSVRLTVPNARSMVRRRGFDAPDLIWLTNPIYQPLAARLDAGCRAVRVADDTTAFTNVPESLRELEDAALADADVIFAVAASVRDRLAERYANVVHLPNGVEFERFDADVAEPADLAAIPGPRVLYVGAMEYWFDAALLAECARALPDASFVLVGPESARVTEAVEGLGNVHLFGRRPYADVPAYMRHCDVGIVPFARSEMVDAIHPIKVYEYLAAGLPVVSVRWPELEAMAAPVELCERDEFCARLEDALGSGRAAGRDARLDYARKNSWDARFEVVLREVGKVLDRSARRL
ncbi:MAG: glycosyltransferase [Anaerosomatales bacterium]|nr:glycosyltransferase [Anaerosomatales bacterium]